MASHTTLDFLPERVTCGDYININRRWYRVLRVLRSRHPVWGNAQIVAETTSSSGKLVSVYLPLDKGCIRRSCDHPPPEFSAAELRYKAAEIQHRAQESLQDATRLLRLADEAENPS